MNKYPVGTKVIVKEVLIVGSISAFEVNYMPWCPTVYYSVQYLTLADGLQYIDVREDNLVPIPNEATPDQIKALISLLQYELSN